MGSIQTPLYFLEGAGRLFHGGQGISHGAVGAVGVFSHGGTEQLIGKGKAEDSMEEMPSCPFLAPGGRGDRASASRGKEGGRKT